MSVAIAGVAWGKVAAITTLGDYAFILAPAALCVFLAVWLGSGRGVYALLLLIIIGCGVLKPILESRLFFPDLPAALIGAIEVGCVLLGFFLTRLALGRGSKLYRARDAQERPLES
jgi:hypothetical protein